MAQVTLSGTIAYGYSTDTATTGVKTSGYGADTGAITFSASEDLGGGLKLAASIGFDGMVGDDLAVASRNSSMTLSGGFGTVSMSSAESSDFLPVDGLTANSNGTDADRIAYTLPSLVEGLTLVVQTQDGTAIAGADRGETVNTFAANYKTGPMSFDLVRADFSIASINSRTGIKAAYNFGVATVTYGQMKHDVVVANGDVTETGLTVSAPLGGATVTLSRATSKTGTAVKRTGNAFGASYALSKRTSIAYNQESYLAATGNASNTKEQSLVLSHSF
jgi:hypothetical protein